MKRIIYLSIVAGIFAGIFGCTEDFQEIDAPKTTSEKIDPKYLFTRSLVTGSGLSVGIWQYIHQTSGSVYAQHWANINSEFTSGNYEPMPGNAVWNWYYARKYFAPLNLNSQVIELAREEENPVKEAPARIWNVYMVQLLTDMYGDIPYFQAFKEAKPPFDRQEAIYKDMIKELRGAIAQIEENRDKGYAGHGQADVLYQGDLDKWVRFANTLGMRIALRASNAAPDEITKVWFNQMDEARTMQANEDNAQIIPDPDGPTYHVKNPLSYVYGWDEVRISKTLMDYLKGWNDPRLEVYGEANAEGVYQGLRNGQPQDTLSLRYSDYFKPDFCNIGSFFIREQTPHYLITYAEACFLKAEAALKGYMSGDPEAYYNQGIRASLEQFGITDAETHTAYIEGQAGYDANNALERIITQRWIALYPNGHEAWSVVRRTGYPEMMKLVYNFPGNAEMPRRVPYPVDERRYNNANYQEAVEQMGGDSQYTRMWWDKK